MSQQGPSTETIVSDLVYVVEDRSRLSGQIQRVVDYVDAGVAALEE